MPTGSKIKEIRQQKGLTQKQLGERCGMADSAIRRYENGKANPKIETLEKIAKALEISVLDLLDDGQSLIETDKTGKIHYIAKTGASHELMKKYIAAYITAAHLDSTDFTEEQWEQIKKFAEFIKSQNNND